MSDELCNEVMANVAGGGRIYCNAKKGHIKCHSFTTPYQVVGDYIKEEHGRTYTDEDIEKLKQHYAEAIRAEVELQIAHVNRRVEAERQQATAVAIEAAARHVPWDYGMCSCGVKWTSGGSPRPSEDWSNHIRTALAAPSGTANVPGELRVAKRDIKQTDHIVYVAVTYAIEECIRVCERNYREYDSSTAKAQLGHLVHCISEMQKRLGLTANAVHRKDCTCQECGAYKAEAALHATLKARDATATPATPPIQQIERRDELRGGSAELDATITRLRAIVSVSEMRRLQVVRAEGLLTDIRTVLDALERKGSATTNPIEREAVERDIAQARLDEHFKSCTSCYRSLFPGTAWRPCERGIELRAAAPKSEDAK